MCSCFLLATQAAPKDWQIIPSTCVINKSGDICRLEISIKPANETDIIPANTCIDLADVRLHCSRQDSVEIKLPVALSETSTLTITLAAGEPYTTTIFVQTIEPVKKRRRVRNPWSLF